MTAARDGCEPQLVPHHAMRAPMSPPAPPSAPSRAPSCAQLAPPVSPLRSHALDGHIVDDIAAEPLLEPSTSPSSQQSEPSSSSSSPPIEPQPLVQNEQQPLLQQPLLQQPQTIQVFNDPHQTTPQSVLPCKPPLIDHDDKENIPPVWMQYALQSKPQDKHSKPFKSKKLAVPLSEAGVQKKRDQSRSPLRDITSTVVGNRRPNLITLRRSPRKKQLTLRYLR